MTDTFRVGELEVLVVSDGIFKAPATAYFAGTTKEQWEPHARWLDHEGNVNFPLGCFLVRSGDRCVLVDTGLGPIESPVFRGGDLMKELTAAGVRTEDVTTVFITHLHADHCGSAALKVDGKMRVTFPNATYRWTAAEDAYWHGELPAGSIARKDVFAAVRPQFEPADGGTTLAPGIDVMSLPGHTPGHAGVVLSSSDKRAFILGDAIGCPAQLEEPEWSGLGDIDPKLARRTQEALAREAEGTGTLVGASHFPGLTFGRVLRSEGRRYWQPA